MKYEVGTIRYEALAPADSKPLHAVEDPVNDFRRSAGLLDHLKNFAFEVISQLFDVLLVVFKQLFAVDLLDLVHVGRAR